MEVKVDLLKLRNDMKKKKPVFKRQDSGVKPQFRGVWRRPRGIHSKMRIGKKGHGAVPAVGYSSPGAVRGLTRDGLKTVNIMNLDMLKDFKEGCVVIGSDVGLKKRILLLEEIVKRDLKVFGVKDVKVYLESLKERVKRMKEERKEKKDKKVKVKKDVKKEKKEEKEKKIKEEVLKKGVIEKQDVAVPVKERKEFVRKITAPKSQ